MQIVSCDSVKLCCNCFAKHVFIFRNMRVEFSFQVFICKLSFRSARHCNVSVRTTMIIKCRATWRLSNSLRQVLWKHGTNACRCMMVRFHHVMRFFYSSAYNSRSRKFRMRFPILRQNQQFCNFVTHSMIPFGIHAMRDLKLHSIHARGKQLLWNYPQDPTYMCCGSAQASGCHWFYAMQQSKILLGFCINGYLGGATSRLLHHCEFFQDSVRILNADVVYPAHRT